MEIKVEKLNIIQKSPEWLALRNKYVGASEVGAIMGINSYQNIKDLLFAKLGFMNEFNNSYMSLGTIFENDILSKFDYYEYNEEQTMYNYLENKKLRKSHRCNESYILYLDNVPFIVSPDGYFIDDDGLTIPIETKFIDLFSIKTNNIEVSIGKYAWQSVLQQLVFNVDYGYIFTLVSNKNLILSKILLDTYESQLDYLIQKTKEFYDILNTCIINDLKINEVNDNFYTEFNITNLSNIKTNLLSLISDTSNISDRGFKYVEGDESDATYASKYLLMLDKEKEIKEYKEIAKKYFILKYGNQSYPIVSDIYKIKLLPKFSITITTPVINNDLNEDDEQNYLL